MDQQHSGLKKTKLKTSVDLKNEDIHWQQDLSYGHYLNLDTILQAQHPLSDTHDEMLFVIVHQASELWLKACLHELAAAMKAVDNDQLGKAFKMMSRVARIQANLEQSWQILSTMTPSDYAAFRPYLGQSSGFQSHQYREMEYCLGNKNARMAEVHKTRPKHYKRLQEVLNAPSFYDLVLRHLAREGFSLQDSVLNRDWRVAYTPDDSVEAAWIKIYRNPDTYWLQYELAEKLVDLETNVQRWRFAHMTTVERIIGYGRGTGGTGGVSYLRKALDLRFFPELWSARSEMVTP